MEGQNVDFSSGDERAERNSDLSTLPLTEPQTGAEGAAVLSDKKEAGAGPAMPMNDKTDMAADLLPLIC